MKKIFFLVCIISFSCSKIDIPEPEPIPKASTAEFILNKSVVYVNESFVVSAKDTAGTNTNYTFDFGDGKKISGKYETSHAYSRGGTYKISLKADDHTHSQPIKVMPGYMSYQIENASAVALDMLTYIDNYKTGTLFRDEYLPQKTSDTFYVTHTITDQYLFGTSFFHHNKEYVIDSTIWFEKNKHHVYTITDSTKIIARHSTGPADTVRYIADFN